VKATNYAYYDGTSMATPHVSAVAALVWSYFPQCSAAQLRSSLDKSALDLGAAGRDVKYGFGLVQAKAAYDRIKSQGCGN
jgi:subtilisin family serine protease